MRVKLFLLEPKAEKSNANGQTDLPDGYDRLALIQMKCDGSTRLLPISAQQSINYMVTNLADHLDGISYVAWGGRWPKKSFASGYAEIPLIPFTAKVKEKELVYLSDLKQLPFHCEARSPTAE